MIKRFFRRIMFIVLLLAIGGIGGYIFATRDFTAPPEKQSFASIQTPEDLKKHSDEFRKGVVKVTDGVYTAVGYGLANSIMIEGPTGVVIVDTMESAEEATKVLAKFREITKKPIEAIIYTHNHTDHIFGAKVFTEGRDIPVYSHVDTNKYIDRVVNIYRPVITQRAMRMFGVYLDEEALVNDGIGPFLGVTEESTAALVRPNRFVKDRLKISHGGIDLELIHQPGETDDQILVWYPKKKVVMLGDNLYKTFPNLYTIRGTPFRSVKQWYQSIDKILGLGAEHIAPSHTRPISGADNVKQILTVYRDGMQYVHDQTVRGINMGMTPDELIEYVQLPKQLKEHPYLAEFYGTVPWSVRSIYAGNLGWYNGNPTNLYPHTLSDQAKRMAQLAGGEDKLIKAANKAQEAGDNQWVLRLTDHLLVIRPDDKALLELRSKALQALGGGASNPNARHFYYTCAKEVTGELKVPLMVGKPNETLVHSFPIEVFMSAIPVNLDPNKVKGMKQKVAFDFPDINKSFTIEIRNQIAIPTPGIQKGVAWTARIDSKIFKEMLAKMRSPELALAKFEVEGGTNLQLANFFKLFKPVEGTTGNRRCGPSFRGK